MFWRFGDPDGPLFEFNDVRHDLRYGDGPLISVPRNPALILALLLEMQRQNRTVTSDQIRNFLRLDERARIKDHVSELRKKLAEAGGDPTRILEHVGGQTGYRLSPGVRAGMVLEADALTLLDRLIETSGPVAPELARGLLNLRSMLSVMNVASVMLLAVSVTSWLVLQPGETPPPRPDDEEGHLLPITAPSTLIPAAGVRPFVTPEAAGDITPHDARYAITLRHPDASACFELPRPVTLPPRSTLTLDLDLGTTSSSARELDISFESAPPDAPHTVVTRPLHAHRGPMTVRIPTSDLAPKLHTDLRRLCITARGSRAEPDNAATVFELIDLRLDAR